MYAVGNKSYNPNLRVVKEMNKAHIIEDDVVSETLEERRILTCIIDLVFFYCLVILGIIFDDWC